MNFLETSPQLSRADISEIEKDLSIVFPNDFVSHYLKYNGGYPEGDNYSWKTGGTTTVNTFCSLKYEGFGNLENTYKNLALLENYFPLGIIAFAVDDGGNFFCISVRKKDFGKVYYLNNDHYEVGAEESALTFLENTFTDFLDGLS
jgi:SMI1 / KNR4 family (SUKH-1)